MTEENQTIEPQDKTYGFEGGKVVLAVEHTYDINGKVVVVPPAIQIFEGKNKVSIKTKNGADSMLRLLRSKEASAHRELLADTLSMDELTPQ